jgi:hypothetical protein
MRASVLIPSEPIRLWGRVLRAWPRPARTMVGFISWRTRQRDRGKRRAVDFCECRHKYISWLRTVLDFAATNDDK